MKDNKPKNPVGRPPVPSLLKKEVAGFRLPKWTLVWLRKQPDGRSQLVLKALEQTYGLKEPVPAGPLSKVGE